MDGNPNPDLQSDDVLPVDFADVVLGQQAVAGGGAVFDQRGDFARLVDEAHVAGAVLVHGDGALERPARTQTHSYEVQIKVAGEYSF